MRSVLLKVPTIKCEGCVDTIRTALSKHPGVQKVEGDPGRKEVTVTFNPDRMTEGDVRTVIAGAGFPVG